MIFFFIVIFLIILGIFIYGEFQYRKVVVPDKNFESEEVDKIKAEKKEPKQTQTKKELARPQEKKAKVQSLGQISLEELKQKGAKKKEEEFDLTPSIDDLIKIKKERIKAY